MINEGKKKAGAFFQIVILVLGLIAISYIVGEGVSLVSAVDSPGTPKTNQTEGERGPVNPLVLNEEEEKARLAELERLERERKEKVVLNFLKSNYGPILANKVYEQIVKKGKTEEVVNLVEQEIDAGAVKRSLEPFLEEVGPVWDQTEEKFINWPGREGIIERFVTKNLGGGKVAKITGTVVNTALHAAGLYYGIRALGNVITDDPKIQRVFDRAATAASIGYAAGNLASKFAGKQIATALVNSGLMSATTAAAIVPVLGWIVAGAAMIVSVLTFKNERYQQITYECMAWQAPLGGERCEECNENRLLPCTEYQCRSLGQGCQLINRGSVNEMCVWINRGDIRYPVLSPWQDALLGESYRYNPVTAISPPDRGVYVNYQNSDDGCVPAFTPLSFGITLDEPARCKISPIKAKSFEEMGNLFMSQGIATYNHSFSLSMPGLSNSEAENITIGNGGNFELYVRCQDSNGNSNPANFVFKYCVDPEPDHTSPLIIHADPLNGLPVSYNTDSAIARFYINEPAECRWSHLDKDFDSMENTMRCVSSVLEMNAQMLYPCITNLTGIKNNVENKFYIRCRDQPLSTSLRNTNSESYEYILIGTQPLVINSVTPNGTTIKGPTSSVRVLLEAKTSAGYDEGKSICYYSSTGNNGSYIQFFNTNSFTHSQELRLVEGRYNYHIRCVDLGGNADTKRITFNVETDTDRPIISRAYKENNNLGIITNEKAECVYTTSRTTECNYAFEDGILMSTRDNFIHTVPWDSESIFYVKCKDEHGLFPPQDECSIIIRPFTLISE